MKILFVSIYFDKDLRTNVHGVYKRMRMFLDGIKEIANLDVLFYVPSDIDISPSLAPEMERSFSEHWNTKVKLFLCPASKFKNEGILLKLLNYGAGVFSLFNQPGYAGICGTREIQAFENCLRHNPDTVFVHRLSAIGPVLRTKKALPPVFFDLDDIEHIALMRNIPQLSKWYVKTMYYTYLPALLKDELRAIRLADKTFVCSETDRQYLKRFWRMSGIYTIPNAVEIPESQPLVMDSTMLFIGSYNHKPNIDAAEFLIEKIWPHIHHAMPKAKLIIAGKYPSRIRYYDHDVPGVKYTGFVDDLKSLYKRTRIVCAPIVSGAGTRVKIIEAAAYGKPIVSTRIGAEGLEMRDGHELLIHDDPKLFSEACLSLLKDYSLSEQLGSAARTRVMQLYNRDNIVNLIQKHMKDRKE